MYEVKEQGSGIEYGILIYDVPQDNPQLYHKVYTRIRKKAIRLNLSVYLFLWGMKEELEGIVTEAQEETGQYATVCVLPFDSRATEEVQRAAKESLIIELKKLQKRLLDTIAKNRKEAEEKGVDFKHIREGYAYQVKNRLEEAHALGMLFGLTHDIKHALESVQKVFASQLEIILGERQENKAKKKAAQAVKSTKKRTRKKREPEVDETETITAPPAVEAEEKVEESTAKVEQEEEAIPAGGSWTDTV